MVPDPFDSRSREWRYPSIGPPGQVPGAVARHRRGFGPRLTRQLPPNRRVPYPRFCVGMIWRNAGEAVSLAVREAILSNHAHAKPWAWHPACRDVLRMSRLVSCLLCWPEPNCADRISSSPIISCPNGADVPTREFTVLSLFSGGMGLDIGLASISTEAVFGLELGRTLQNLRGIPPRWLAISITEKRSRVLLPFRSLDGLP